MKNNAPINIGIIDIINKTNKSLYVLNTIIVPMPSIANRIPAIFGFFQVAIRVDAKINVGSKWIKKPIPNLVSNENRVINRIYRIIKILEIWIDLIFIFFIFSKEFWNVLNPLEMQYYMGNYKKDKQPSQNWMNFF